MKSFILLTFIILFSNSSWATICTKIFPKQPSFVEQLPQELNTHLYHMTLIAFIQAYNIAILQKPSYELFKTMNTQLFSEKEAKRQMLYILELWNTHGHYQATIIKSELIDSISAVKGKFNLKLLKNLAQELYSLLDNLAGQTYSSQYLKQLTMVDFEYKKTISE